MLDKNALYIGVNSRAVGFLPFACSPPMRADLRRPFAVAGPNCLLPVVVRVSRSMGRYCRVNPWIDVMALRSREYGLQSTSGTVLGACSNIQTSCVYESRRRRARARISKRNVCVSVEYEKGGSFDCRLFCLYFKAKI